MRSHIATGRRFFRPAALLDGLLPRHCVLCGAACGAANLCSPCRADLPRADRSCTLCALPIRLAPDTVCGACLRRPPAWDGAVSGLLYRFPVDQLVCRLKFSRDLACAEILAREMLDAVILGNTEAPQMIVPVPLHRTRHFLRTFNQADLLARRLGEALGIPVCSRLLARTRRTPAQSGLDADQRRRNIRGAFACRAGGATSPAGQHVALVDDVMTTGATLDEGVRVLTTTGYHVVATCVVAAVDARRALAPRDRLR